MKLKEFMNKSSTISNLGTNKFRLTLDKEAVKTPHYIMSKVLNMLESRPSVRNGLRQHVRFILKDIMFRSEDDKSQVYANEWLNQRNKLKKELFKFTELLIACGTSYLEPEYDKYTNGSKKLNTLHCFPDPSIVYKNLAASSEEDYWIIEVPLDVRSYGGQTPSHFPVYYMRGSYVFRRMVYGIPRHKNSLIQVTTGWSRTNDYGWGLLSSAVDNDDILEEIIKNWSLIAKFRSLGKKIIGFYNDNGESVDPTEIDNIKQELSELEEEDSLLVNKKFVSEPLTFTGDDNMMDEQVSNLKKEIGSSLTPNYMTPWSQDSSYATAQESKVPFSLELESTQEELVDNFNEIIISRLKEEINWLADDLTFELPKPELYSRETLFQMFTQLYNMRACTFNELRKSAGLSVVEGGDIWGEEPPLDNINIDTKKQQKLVEKLSKNKTFKEFVSFKSNVKRKPEIVFEESANVVEDKKKKFKEAVKSFLG